MKNNSFLSSEEIVKSFLSYLDDSIYSYAYIAIWENLHCFNITMFRRDCWI